MQDGICRGEQKVNCPKGKRGHPGVLLVRAVTYYDFAESQCEYVRYMFRAVNNRPYNVSHSASVGEGQDPPLVYRLQ